MDVEKRVKIGKTQKVIMGALASGAVITMAAFAPNAMRLLKPLIKNRYSRYNFWKSMAGLEKSGLAKKDNNGKFRLTEKGQNLLLSVSPKLIKKQFRWDGSWRIIIFDIPKGRERTRQQLRHLIKAYGFLLLQKSVWVYPYPCEDLITVMKSELRLGKQLIYMVVEEMEGDKYIREHFSLN